MIDYQRLKNDLLALGLFAATLFVALALFSYDSADPPSTSVYPARTYVTNLCGPTGAFIAHLLVNAFGLGAWFFLVSLFCIDMGLFSRKQLADPVVRIIGALTMLISLCLLLHLTVPNLPNSPLIGSGGYLGAWGRVLLMENFSIVGSIVIIATLFCVGMILATETLFFRIVYRVFFAPLLWCIRSIYTKKQRPPVSDIAVEKIAARKLKPELEAEPELEPEGESEPAEIVEIVEGSRVPTEFKVNAPVTVKGAGQGLMSSLFKPKVRERLEQVDLPSLDILEDAEEFPFELLAKKAQEAAVVLERTFEEFGLNVKVAEIDTGPVVTQFELTLEPGLRISKVVNLADDLAVALRVPAVRVVSPIPGKNTVGVEVPNEKQVTVRLKELAETMSAEADKMAVPIFLGKDVSGRPLVVDMTKMPHLLIAGRTGTGKSVCLNTLITSILMTRTPDEVRMLMIDPKMVELSPYTRIPHLMNPVITDMKKAEAVLAWAVDKMEERYDLLAKVGVRHLDSYNKLGREKVLDRMGIAEGDEEADDVPDRMPYIVIVADEMADLMMTNGKEVESHIIRLAQKSRAVGIHLVLATQKPTVDVITGLIKSNLPARISFQVASRTDSRVVLDEMGAERLLGNGDMLYLAPGTSSVTRAQGTYISDEEVNSVIEFYSDYEPRYSPEIEQATKAAMSAGPGGGGVSTERDAMYQQAVSVVLSEGRGSVSLLQRALGVGYGRAARMVDHMAEDGIVGDYNGSKCREVICSFEEWEARQEAMEMAM